METSTKPLKDHADVVYRPNLPDSLAVNALLQEEGVCRNVHSPLDEQTRTIDRQSFLKLPLESRRRILAAQSEIIAPYYDQDPNWREWTEVSIGEIYEYEYCNFVELIYNVVFGK